jgi:hypothetical protein
MKQLQEEHAAWLQVMYPEQPKEHPALGMVEEAGELLHVVLKRSEAAKYGEKLRYVSVDWQEKLIDAVGDCAIYVCSYCNAAGWEFSSLCKVRGFNGEELKILAVKLVQSATEFALSHKYTAMIVYMMRLSALCEYLHIDLETATRATWAKVKERTR